MKHRHHRQGPASHKWHTFAAVLAFVLTIFAAPAASAEPLEGDTPGNSTAQTEPDTKWPQRQLENLIGQEAGASDTSLYQAQQEAYLRYLEQKAAAANGGEPAIEASADDSGGPWLVGVGLVAIVATASIILAMVRSRRQEVVAPAMRDLDKLQV
jgi:hypothetical protein